MKRTTAPPAEWLAHDEPLRCPYLPGEIARLPLRLPARPLRREEFSRRLAEGDRRNGIFLYRPTCPTCRACQPVRVDVPRFQPRKSHRRILRRGRRIFRVELGTPTFSPEHLRLYNLHKLARGLSVGSDILDATQYVRFLVDTCVETIEIRYWAGERLAAVAIADRASDALSAVYCYFDPEFSRLSPGTFSILTEIDLCRRWGLRWLYLGLYVRGCPAMEYKAGYLPQERLIDGRWVRFER